MAPCVQEETIKDIYKMISDLRVSDGKKDEQIKSLVAEVHSLVSWIKILVVVATPAVLIAIGFLINFWIKGG